MKTAFNEPFEYSVSSNCMKCLRWYSQTNIFMDFVVVVPTVMAYDAANVVVRTMDAWWEDNNSEAYGWTVERAMQDAGIPCLFVYHGDMREDQEYEDSWEDVVRSLDPVDLVSSDWSKELKGE